MPLKSDVVNAWPPGGWQFFQPETNWGAPSPMVYTFMQQVSNIQAMRKQNPRFHLATDFLTVARELESYTCRRLENHPKYCITDDGDEKKKSSPQSASPESTAPEGEAVAEVGGRDSKIDPRALREWLGAGLKPVDRALAEKRAAICAVCPENSESSNCPVERRKSWQAWFTAAVANALRKYIAIRYAIRAETSKDEELGKCLACHCELQLKVHTPLHHLRDNMDEPTIQRLRRVKKCWVMNE